MKFNKTLDRTEAVMADQRPKASSKLVLENERVIVTEWRLASRAETGWHRHSYDYVVVCLTAGKLVAETPTGTIDTDLRFGESYARQAGVEHNIVNPEGGEFAFIEIELK
jgi:quercetin dioxygenase-like cupin family protein